MSDVYTTSGGIGFVGVLTILFIALKLLNIIDWSWWWILSPIWISIIVTLSIIFIMIAIYCIVECFST